MKGDSFIIDITNKYILYPKAFLIVAKLFSPASFYAHLSIKL